MSTIFSVDFIKESILGFDGLEIIGFARFVSLHLTFTYVRTINRP